MSALSPIVPAPGIGIPGIGSFGIGAAAGSSELKLSAKGGVVPTSPANSSQFTQFAAVVGGDATLGYGRLVPGSMNPRAHCCSALAIEFTSPGPRVKSI